MARVNAVTAVLVIILCPAAFVRRSVKHDVALEFERNTQLLGTYPNRELPPDRLTEFEKSAWDRTRKIRTAFFMALCFTAGAIILGLLTGQWIGRVIGTPIPAVVTALQITGAGMILLATLALLGWEIQPFKGQTLPEKVNRWLFRTLYCFGTFLFIVSLGWTS